MRAPGSRHWNVEWTRVETVDARATAGRLVRSTTRTPAGDVDVGAVCITWSDAHVRTGGRFATRWSEHLEFCGQLASSPVHSRTILAGDFNQRIPRYGQPIAVAAALDLALRRFDVATAGPTHDGRLIDHVAITRDLRADSGVTWPRIDRESGLRLSDHSGVVCDVVTQAA